MNPPITSWFGFVEGSENLSGAELKSLLAADPRVQALMNYFANIQLDTIPEVNSFFRFKVFSSMPNIELFFLFS